MDEVTKRFNRGEASMKIVEREREKMIADGSYPAKFSFPLAMQFEITSKCNLRCKHCYNRSGENKTVDAVTGDDWIAFAKKLVAKGGLFEATISGGEPLLLGDKLFELMDVLHADNTTFNLISNGYLFDQKILDRFKKYQFYWLQISMDSCNSARHDEFRGVKGSWARAANAAYRIALAGIPLRIATTVTPRELEHLEEMVQTAINLGASYLVIGEVMPSGRAFDNEDIFLSREQLNLFYTTTNELVKLGNILRDDVEDIWAKYSDCWQHPLVKKFIESCDPISGKNSFAENYNGEDIYL